MITPSFSRKLRLLFILMALPLAGLFAASESYVQSLTGHLQKGDSLTVIDDKFLNLPLEQWNKIQHLAINDLITFELRHDTAVKFYTQAFTCTMNVTIKYFTSRDDQTPKEIDSVNLVVNYDTARGKPYADIAHYRFKNAFKVIVVINSMSSPQWKNNIPDCFRLKAQIQVERKYPFDPHGNGKLHLGAYQPLDMQGSVALQGGPLAGDPNGGAVDVNGINGQLAISWTAGDFTGAEEFDLEWTFVDTLSTWGQAIGSLYGGQGPFSIPENAEQQWMWHNTTRVTVTSSPYMINLPYVNGYLLVRIRSAYYQSSPALRITGDWVYANDQGTTAAVYVPRHQLGLNWQYTGSFAEEGKRKEVTTYYDGSQRSRQSVTINNSDLTKKADSLWTPTAVVQETIYDLMGRPAVNILPAPTKSSVLDYIHTFNLNHSGTTYSFADIQLNSSPAACTVVADSMSISDGASQYYSPANSFLDPANLGSYYFNPYIPDAKQFPYSLTQYTPDNTGRLARQGGVGPTMQVGRGHETKYYYSKPTITELLKMFGMEVGDPSHYLKNMVIDANGQASVSYVDANGKTIATALAGPAPGTMDSIPSNTISTAETTFNDVLIQPSDLTVDAGALNMSATTTFIAEATGRDSLIYSVNPYALVTSYAGGTAQLCNNCYYNVLVKVFDPCGNVLDSNTSAPFQGNDFTCHVNPPPVTQGFSFTVSQLGTYTVLYSLQLSNDVINAQTNYYVKTNTDLKTLENFFIQELNALDLSGCYSSCTACKSLGSITDFTNNVMNLLQTDNVDFAGINVSDPAIQTWIGSAYGTLEAKCGQLNCSPPSPCIQKLTQLEQDCLPGGQYAMYDATALDNNAATVFLQPQINVMEYYNQDPNIANLTVATGNGTTQTVGSLGQADFIRAYLQHPEWDALFVVHHIEYCSYLWCKDASNPVPADDNEVSYTWDANLQQNYTVGSDAVNAGYYNHADPYALLEKDPWFNAGRGQSYYSDMHSDLQNLSAVLGLAPTDNTVSPPAALPAKNIVQWIDWSLYCNPANSSVSAAQLTASWQNCNPSDACRSVTMEWTMYLNYYLQLKSKYYQIAKAAYFAINPAAAPNQGCQDCFIGGDILSTGGCVPPDALTTYSVIQQTTNNQCNYYIVYNGGSSPFPSSYTITFQGVSTDFNGNTTVVVGPSTVTCNANDMQVLIQSSQIQQGAQCGFTGSWQITNVVCAASALSTCAASNPGSSSGSSGSSGSSRSSGSTVTCPTASSFSLSGTLISIGGPHEICITTTYDEFLNYSGPAVAVPVTVPVQAVETITYYDANKRVHTIQPTPITYNVVFSPGGPTKVRVGSQAFEIVEPNIDQPQCEGVSYTFNFPSAPTCALPPPPPPPPPPPTITPGPASSCPSNSNYALYAGKVRVFNDYVDVQDYTTCVANSLSSGSESSATSAAALLAAAQANLTVQKGNWLSLLQNVRSQYTQFSSITNTQLTTLVNDLYSLSLTYLQIAAQQNTAVNIVSSLPNPLPSGFTAPNGFYSFTDAFNSVLGSSMVSAGFGPELIDNVYPYNKVPYVADPNVVSLSSAIYSNVQSNLATLQAASTASGSSSFAGYLQQQLGDDDLLTPTQVSDLQSRIASGCSYPYLTNPAILPVSLVVAPPSGVSTAVGNVATPPVAWITCSQLSSVTAGFQGLYGGVSSTATDGPSIQLYQTLWTNYLNHQLGYPLSYADYNTFQSTCNANSSALLYDKPQTMSVADNVFDCAAAQIKNAYSRAGQEYTAYITQIRIQFRNSYISKCLSNQASANLVGKEYQYHYTLYYYDQSGDLVKTVPPEGVHLLSDQDVATIEQVPTQSPGTCAALPSTVLYNQSSILSQMSTNLQGDDVQAMG